MQPQKGSRLLRKGRRSIPNQPYLITTATRYREKRFLNASAAAIVLSSLKWLEDQNMIIVVAAVVMPDHFHMLATLKTASLSEVMRRFKGFTAKQINSVSGGRGPVWQRHYHDHAIRREEDLNEVIEYLLNNPVRKGLVADFHDSPFWYCRWPV